MFTVLDIGARGGLHQRWNGLPVSSFGVEADADECARLNRQSTGLRYLQYAVAGSPGDATFYVTSAPGCSSLLQPDNDVIAPFPVAQSFHVRKTVAVTVTTLDEVCARESLQPDVLKLDVQGAELDILRGAPVTLAHVLAVECEVEFRPIYVGQPLFADVDTFMRGQGFELLGLRRDYWRRQVNRHAAGGTLVHGDALYVHEWRLAAVPEKAQVFWRAYRQYDRLSAVSMPPRWRRWLGRAMRQVATHRQWRAWLDACAAPASDWHDPDDYF